MLTPSTLTLAQTAIGTVAIDTTTIAGELVELAFDLSGVPAGVKFWFSPPRAKVGDPVTLNVLADCSVGTFPVTVVAKGKLVSHNATLTLVVTASDFGI